MIPRSRKAARFYACFFAAMLVLCAVRHLYPQAIFSAWALGFNVALLMERGTE